MRVGAFEVGGTKMIQFFEKRKIDALGIGCFGPIDQNPSSLTYGYITTTPKAGWKNCNLVGAFQAVLNVPNGGESLQKNWQSKKKCGA